MKGEKDDKKLIPKNKTEKKKVSAKKITGIFCAAAIGYSILSYAAAELVNFKIFSRVAPIQYSAFKTYKEYSTLSRKEVDVMSSGTRLTAYVYDGTGTKGLVIIAHGIHSDADGYLSETEYFVNNGYRVISYDATGSGKSDGNSNRGFPQGVIDLENVIEYARKTPEFANCPFFLFGHSWGAYSVAAVLKYRKDISGVVCVSGFNNGTEMIAKRGTKFVGAAVYAGIPFIKLQAGVRFGLERESLTAVEAINSAPKTSVLVLHGDQDSTIMLDEGIISHQSEITNTKTQFKIVEGRGHEDVCRSVECMTYLKTIEEGLMQISKKYGKKPPKEVLDTFYKSIDKEITKGINIELLNTIDEFYINSKK